MNDTSCKMIVQVLLDCGAVQADALTVDRLASLEKVYFKTFLLRFFLRLLIEHFLPSFILKFLILVY